MIIPLFPHPNSNPLALFRDPFQSSPPPLLHRATNTLLPVGSLSPRDRSRPSPRDSNRSHPERKSTTVATAQRRASRDRSRGVGVGATATEECIAPPAAFGTSIVGTLSSSSS
ncbi:hypothetical protein Trydic_g18658 [Trypoxylus dichotomus]